MDTVCEIVYFDNYGKEQRELISVENGWSIDSCTAKNQKLGIEIPFRERNGMLSIPLGELYENGRCRVKSIIPLPEYLAGVENDGGELILPFGSGAVVRHAGHEAKECLIGLFFPWGAVGLMSLFAMRRNGKVRTIIVDGGRCEAQMRLRTNYGKKHSYELGILFQVRDFQSDTPSKETISLITGEFEKIADAAKHYREYICNAFNIPTLAEKIENNPVMEHNSRSLAMRCRLGVKELPCKILDQTPDNLPPFRKFMSFADVRTIADECARQNLFPIDWCLVGWNYGGHDGAFPQLFPVCEELGGETELRKTIEHLKSLGYAIGLHDNYVDGYTLAKNFRYTDVNREQDGSMSLNQKLGGGQAYIMCPEKAYEHAKKNMEKVKSLNTNGIYFTDVCTVWPLMKCYDSQHPLSRTDCAKWRGKLLHLLRETFGAVMSEGAQDWAVPFYDRCYDMIDTPKYPDWCDYEIPLYQMVWHGVLVYNTYRGDINTYPGDHTYLRNLSFGGLPIIYWHYIFNPAWTAEGGCDPKKDLRFDPETLTEKVRAIKEVVNDVNRMEVLRTAFFTDYIQHSPTLTESYFSNGLSLYANFGMEDVEVDGKVIPAGNFEIF